MAEKTYDTNDNLPWDLIDIGINKDWLIQEYKKAINSESSKPCEFECSNCGVCSNLKTKKVIDKPYITDCKTPAETINDSIFKYRIKLTKENELRYISHLDWQNTIHKALFRSGLKLAFSQGFNPTPKTSLGIALPIFYESKTELIDLDLKDNLKPEEIEAALTKVVPQNIKIIEVVKISKETKSIDTTAQWAEYECSVLKEGILNFKELMYIINKISSSDEIFIEKKTKKGIKKLINVKPSIKSASIIDDKLMLVLKTGQNTVIPSIKPDELLNLFYPEVNFRIIRTKFFDEILNEL